MHLRAWGDQRSSSPIVLAEAGAHIDITVGPTGTLEVTAAVVRSDVIEFIYARPTNVDVGTVMYMRSPDSNNAYRFDELPTGEYLVFRSTHYLSEDGAKKVVVTAGNVATVRLDL
jgi:hypothetical protein